MFDFAGKKAFITGGTRGIGLSVAVMLAKAGADVAVNYLRNRSAADEARNAIMDASGGKEPLLLKGNVAKDDDIEKMFAEIGEKWGGLNFLISNAASGVLVRSRITRQCSRFGALNTSSSAGGAERFQNVYRLRRYSASPASSWYCLVLLSGMATASHTPGGW